MRNALCGCTISAKLGPEYGQHKMPVQLIILGTASMPSTMHIGNALQGKQMQIIIREYFVCHLVKYETLQQDIDANIYGPTITSEASPFFILPEYINNIYL